MIPYNTLNDLVLKLKPYHLETNSLVTKSLSQAQSSHGKQIRDDGSSYLEQHIYPVTIGVVNYYENQNEIISPEVISGALLHDCLEDDLDIDDLKFVEIFGYELYKIVKPLTKEDYRTYPGKDKWKQKWNLDLFYVPGIKSASEETKIIKLADRLNNISCSKFLSLEKRDFYIKETEIFYLPLAKQYPYFFDRIKEKLDELKPNSKY